MLEQLFPQIAGIIPLPCAEVRYQVYDAVLIVALAQQLADRLHRIVRPSGGLRDGDLAECRVESVGKLRVHGFPQHVGLTVAADAAGAGKSQQRELLGMDLPRGLGANPLDRGLGLFHRAAADPAVGHREAIVQQHDVMDADAAQPAAPLVPQQRLGHAPAPAWRGPPSAAATAAVA